MKKVSGILAVAVFMLGMLATTFNTNNNDFSDLTTAMASDDDYTEPDEREM